MNANQIQGVLVKIEGKGVLIRGEPGRGKSMAALGLMERGHKLVADDLVSISRRPDGALVGAAVTPDVKIEIRGLGVFDANNLINDGTSASSTVDLVIQLDAYEPMSDSGRIEPDWGTEIICDAEVPRVRLPVADSAYAPLLIELLARRMKEIGKL